MLIGKRLQQGQTISSHLPEPALYPTNFSFFAFSAGKCSFWLKSQRRAMQSESEVAQLCPTLCNPMDCSYQAPLSMGFSRWEYWSGLPFPSLGDLPNPAVEPGSPALQADALWSEPPGKSHKEGLIKEGLPKELQTLFKTCFDILLGYILLNFFFS